MTDVYPDYPDVVLGMVIVDCHDPERLAEFWGALLGRQVLPPDEPYVGLEWSPRFGAGLVFQRVSEPKVGKNRIHVDIICADVAASVARAEELGATRAEGYEGAQGFVVMLDPEDNEFCLVPPPGS